MGSVIAPPPFSKATMCRGCSGEGAGCGVWGGDGLCFQRQWETSMKSQLCLVSASIYS